MWDSVYLCDHICVEVRCNQLQVRRSQLWEHLLNYRQAPLAAGQGPMSAKNLTWRRKTFFNKFDIFWHNKYRVFRRRMKLIYSTVRKRIKQERNIPMETTRSTNEWGLLISLARRSIHCCNLPWACHLNYFYYYYYYYYYYPPASEASREVANLTWRKNPHTPVYGAKEFVCLPQWFKTIPHMVK